jgi:hypothetical protein
VAFTVTFDVGTPCAGTRHAPVTATRVETGQSITVTIDRTQAQTELTAQERKELLELLIRLLCSQAPDATAVQLRNAVEATTLDLTLVGF